MRQIRRTRRFAIELDGQKVEIVYRKPPSARAAMNIGARIGAVGERLNQYANAAAHDDALGKAVDEAYQDLFEEVMQYVVSGTADGEEIDCSDELRANLDDLLLPLAGSFVHGVSQARLGE
jgi:hypothetical protein